MTQYPYPSFPPAVPGTGPYPPVPDPLGPSRRASVLLLVIGVVALLGGLGMAAFPWLVSIGPSVEELRASVPPDQLSQLPPGWTLERLVWAEFIVLGVLAAGSGVLLLCLAPAVRRGGRASTATALILFCLVGAGWLLVLLAALLQLDQHPSPQIIASLFFVLVVGGVVLVALLVLGQALRASGRLRRYPQPMPAPYAPQPPGFPPGPQRGGYGYGYAPPPAPHQPPESPGNSPA